MFEKDIELLQIPCNQDEFLANLYQGFSKGESCAMMRISPMALDRVLEDDSIFAARLIRAEAFYADKMTDKLYTIHEDFEDARMAQVVSENYKWLAKTRKRERYGDKTENTNTTQINLNVAISDARKRVIDYNGAIPLNTLQQQTDNISVEQPLAITIDKAKKPYVDPLS